MMVKYLILSLLLSFNLLNAETDWDGNLNLSLGTKTLDGGDWDPVDDQGFIGIQLDIGKKSWPVSFALQHLISAASEERTTGGLTTETDSYTSEIRIGIMKNFEISGEKHILSFGGGAALIDAEIETISLGVKNTDDDDGYGFWLSAGYMYRFWNKMNVGGQIQYSDADVTLFGIDRNAGGIFYNLLIGYHW